MSFELIPEGLSERQQKESVDIVLFTGFNPVCVRVQGGDHGGILKSARDSVQIQMLEWSNCIVIDLWHYDCPVLFSEKLNDESRREVKEAFKYCHGAITKLYNETAGGVFMYDVGA